MMTGAFHKVMSRVSVLLVAALLVFSPAAAHGPAGHQAEPAQHHGQHSQTGQTGQTGLNEKHDKHEQHDAHMAAMSAFTASVPEEYRIMDRTPVIDSQESLLNGRKLFVQHCAVCHGRLGRGDGPGAAGLPNPPADFLDFAHSAHYGPGEKYWIIANGSADLGMPAHPQLAPKEVWHLVNYILALQAKVKEEGYDSPPHKH